MHHTTQQGEHLSGIAHLHGFIYDTLWQHAGNSELRNHRKTPHILLPGDDVSVPEKQLKEEQRSTDQKHTFRLKARPLILQLILDRRFGNPVANAPCDLQVDLDKASLVTSGDGELQRRIRPTDKKAILTVQENAAAQGQVVTTPRELPILIGFLDPIDEPSGWLGRLSNLGYYRGPIPGDAQSDDVRSAVEEFQCDQNLAVDGVFGPNTQAKLKSIHGC